MAWTQFLAEGLQADPVITTASDVNGRLAVDVWAVRHGLQITDRTLAKYAAAVFVTGEPLPFMQSRICGYCCVAGGI